MNAMISKVYDAFLAAGTPEDKARRAAEALMRYESRFSKLENDIATIEWMLALIIALLAAVALKLFLH